MSEGVWVSGLLVEGVANVVIRGSWSSWIAWRWSC